MEIQPGPPGTYFLWKNGKKFGEAVFWEGHDRPVIDYQTPPGLTPMEEEEICRLRNPWKTES